MTEVSMLDAIELIDQHSFGRFYNTANVRFGLGHNHIPTYLGLADGNRTFFAADMVETGSWIFTASYLRTHVGNQSVEPLLDGSRMFGPQGQAIANAYSADNKILTVSSFGVTYDPGKWFVMAEFAKLRSTSFFGNRNG